MAQRFVLMLALMAMCAPLQSSAEWSLVITHSNDLWYQLDEIQGNDTPCYVDLPPLTTSTSPTTTPSTTTSTPIATTTTTTPSTTATTMPSTTTTTTPSTTPTTTPSTDTTPNTTSELPPETSTKNETNFQDLTEIGSERAVVQDQPKVTECYGGVSRHLSKIMELKSKSELQNKIFLNLNAGGMLGGYIWYPILGSGPAVESMQMLNFNAVALGYRDFEEGVAKTVEYLKELKKTNITVLCANMDTTGEPAMAGLYEKSKIFEISGRKIGIVGYIGEDADYMADTGKIKFSNPKDAIENEVTILLRNGATFIIALGSAGYSGGMDLLNRTFNVDLIINGGSNTFLYNGPIGPLGETPKGPYPITSDVQSTTRLLVQTSRYGKYLGNLDLRINDEGRIIDFTATNPILLDKNVIPNPELQAKVDDWERQVLTQTNEVIGYAKIPIISDRKYCWYEECTGASMMADAARWFLEKNTTATNLWDFSVAAAVWHGGALSDTDLDIEPGPIKYGDILYMFPYANEIAIAYMTGSQIKTLFEKSVEYYNDTSSPNRGEFLHVSGIQIKYDLSKPSGQRVASIRIRDTSNTLGGMNPVVDDSAYIIGMPTFIANGGSRYGFMENVKTNNTGVRDENVLKEFIKLFSPLAYGKEGRIQFVGDDGGDPPIDCPSTDVTGTVFLTIFLTLLFTGLLFAAYKYIYPKLRDRRGSLLSLVR